jgi:hypothetical protein
VLPFDEVSLLYTYSCFRYKRVGSTRFVPSGSVWGSFSNVSFANAFSNSADRINGYN